MAINGKSKGNEFERHVSKTLSLWWTSGETDSVFWRTQNSGARYTIRKRVDKDTYHQGGDICDVDPIGKPFCDKFMIELKCYKVIDLWNMINENGFLVEWWNKLNASASDANKIPLLIVKQNNKPILCRSGCNQVSNHQPDPIP